MVKLLARLFVPDRENTRDPDVRRRYGMLCGILGILLNVFLFAGKYLAGAISGAVSIMADAFNNLSDAGASLITLIGFKFAGMKADHEHPFGHGRIEYIAGVGVSVAIIVMGVQLFTTSVEKIIHPEEIVFSWLSVVILAVSIGVKVYMCLYNRSVGRKIDSATMDATAIDSLTDSVATVVVLLSMLVHQWTDLNTDGWCGVLVSLFIVYSGIHSAKETLTPLLGKAPDPEFVKRIEEIVMAHSCICGIHDLIVHDYGPGRVFVSLHAEVPAKGDILVLHDTIDLAERELNQKMGCEAVIHMDPILNDDPHVMQMREEMAEMAREIDDRITIHDFRIVQGPTHTNVIFDVALPQDLALSDGEMRERLQHSADSKWENCFLIVTIDRIYV